jgi:hypothetical protein
MKKVTAHFGGEWKKFLPPDFTAFSFRRLISINTPQVLHTRSETVRWLASTKHKQAKNNPA